MAGKNLLFIIERGGYPVYVEHFAQAGYNVTTEPSMRKALARLKTEMPDIILAEFNYGPRYGMQISNLEPLLARIETVRPSAKVIAFTEKEYAHHLDVLRQRFAIFDALVYPLQKAQLIASVERAAREI